MKTFLLISAPSSLVSSFSPSLNQSTEAVPIDYGSKSSTRTVKRVVSLRPEFVEGPFASLDELLNWDACWPAIEVTYNTPDRAVAIAHGHSRSWLGSRGTGFRPLIDSRLDSPQGDPLARRLAEIRKTPQERCSHESHSKHGGLPGDVQGLQAGRA